MHLYRGKISHIRRGGKLAGSWNSRRLMWLEQNDQRNRIRREGNGIAIAAAILRMAVMGMING